MSSPTDSKEPAEPAQQAPAAPQPSAPSPPPDSVTASDHPVTPAEPASDAPAEPIPQQQDQPRDPKVAQLKALFPDLEDGVLEAVLEGCAGSLDEATEQLLVMSDPNFKTDTTELSQLEADEELARQLAREDELAQAQQRVNAPHRSGRSHAQQQPHPQAPAQPLGPLTYQPYVPKSRRTAAAGPASPSLSSWQPPAEQARTQPEQGQGQAHQRDELQELTEQFNKVADTGKRMFGSFLSKAKEQIARVDEAIVRSAEHPPAPPPKSALPQRSSPTSSSSWSPPSALPRPSDGPPRSSSPPSSGGGGGPIVMIDRTGLTEDGRSRSTSPGPLPPPSEKPLPAASEAPPAANTSASAGVDSPKKDFSKQIPGLLPRQSFSLLDAKGPKSPSAGSEDKGAPAAAPAAGVVRSPLAAPNHALGDDDDSEDELEYTRSPFDDD
ncbi:hypothetical protein JCM10450v2_001874 [Rhodotorula kratochvilovae]